MRIATRTALGHLIDAAIEARVAFVIVAGDIYDGDWPDFGTGLFFCAAMGRLERAGIDVYLLFGNHDAASVLTKRLPLPGNVHVFKTRGPETFVHEPTGTALHGWSYRDRDMRENLAAGYPAASANRFNIGVLHTALSGRPPHASYAPCTIDDLAAKGYDYWALGHVHEFEVVATTPLIVFPGVLQGRNIRETGRKGAVMVTVEDDRVVSPPEVLALDAVRWARVDVDLAGAETEAQLHGRVRASLEQAWREHSDGRPLLIRVTLVGATPLHGSLAIRRDALRAEVRAMAAAISERLWIEKVLPRTAAVAQSRVADPTPRDELATLLSEGAKDRTLRASLAAELAEFLARAPPDLEADGDLFTDIREGAVTRLLEDSAVALDARLAEDAG